MFSEYTNKKRHTILITNIKHFYQLSTSYYINNCNKSTIIRYISFINRKIFDLFWLQHIQLTLMICIYKCLQESGENSIETLT